MPNSNNILAIDFLSFSELLSSISQPNLRRRVKHLFMDKFFLTDATVLFEELTENDLINLLRLKQENGKTIFEYIFREPPLCKIVLRRLSAAQLLQLCQLQTSEGGTLLHFVFRYNDWCCEELIKKLSAEDLTNYCQDRDFEGSTPAHYLFKRGSADYNLRNSQALINKLSHEQFTTICLLEDPLGFTPLDYIMQKGDQRCCEMAIAKLPFRMLERKFDSIVKSVTTRSVHAPRINLTEPLEEFQIFLLNAEQITQGQSAKFLAYIRMQIRTRTSPEDRLFLVNAIKKAITAPLNVATRDILKGLCGQLYFSLENQSLVPAEGNHFYRMQAHQHLLNIGNPANAGLSSSDYLTLGESLTVVHGSSYGQAVAEANSGKLPSFSGRSAICDLNYDCHTALRKSLEFLAEALRRSYDQQDSKASAIYNSASTLFLNYLGLDDCPKHQTALEGWLTKAKKSNLAPLIELKLTELTNKSKRLQALGWSRFNTCLVYFLQKYKQIGTGQFLQVFTVFKFQIEIAMGIGNNGMIKEIFDTLSVALVKEIAIFTESPQPNTAPYVAALEKLQNSLPKLLSKFSSAITQVATKSVTQAPVVARPQKLVEKNNKTQSRPVPIAEKKPNLLSSRSSRVIPVRPSVKPSLVISTTLLQKLKEKIVELPGRSTALFMAESTRKILVFKSNQLNKILDEYQQYLDGKINLQQLSTGINQCASAKEFNIFCYFFGTSQSSLFSAQKDTGTMQLLQQLSVTVHR